MADSPSNRISPQPFRSTKNTKGRSYFSLLLDLEPLPPPPPRFGPCPTPKDGHLWSVGSSHIHRSFSDPSYVVPTAAGNPTPRPPKKHRVFLRRKTNAFRPSRPPEQKPKRQEAPRPPWTSSPRARAKPPPLSLGNSEHLQSPPAATAPNPVLQSDNALGARPPWRNASRLSRQPIDVACDGILKACEAAGAKTTRPISISCGQCGARLVFL